MGSVAAAMMRVVLFVALSACMASALSVVNVGSEHDDPDDYLPMPPYRCIRHGNFADEVTGATQEAAIQKMLLSVLGAQKIRDDPKCGVIDPAWCKEEGKPLLPCPHKREPYDLVFDPFNGVCNNKDTAPPGTCYDTPTGPTNPPTKSTTPMPKPTPTTPKRTTSKRTTPKRTTTTPKPTTTPKLTTPSPAADCTYVGEKLPYPGDCHKYYLCLKADGSSHFHVVPFTCKKWVYDPNAYSCVASSKATENLC